MVTIYNILLVPSQMFNNKYEQKNVFNRHINMKKLG